MPRKAINYQNSLIYKIVCRDTSITSCYVGSTTNFVKRKQLHKSTCKGSSVKYKVYEYIRENGGWDNWHMVMIEPFPCENALELERRERYFMQILNSDLNTYVPAQTYDDKSRKEYAQTYRDNNKEYMKKYREKNMEKLKDYYEFNKEHILAQQNRPFTCECGSVIRFVGKSNHYKTKKHLSFLSNKTQQPI